MLVTLIHQQTRLGGQTGQKMQPDKDASPSLVCSRGEVGQAFVLILG